MYQTFFTISYPKDPLYKNAIFASRKRRFHQPKTMFPSIRNIVLEKPSQAASPSPKGCPTLPLVWRGGGGKQSFPEGAWIQVANSLLLPEGAWIQVDNSLLLPEREVALPLRKAGAFLHSLPKGRERVTVYLM